MKKFQFFASMAVVTLLSACLPSLNPFYTERELRFEPGLLGEWHQKNVSDGPEFWEFEKTGDQNYKLTVTEKDNKDGQFNAHLFQLGDKLFLDIIPAECKFAPIQTDLVEYSVFPGHLLFQIVQLKPTLKIAFTDFDWLNKFLEKNPKALAHHREEKRVILTASTQDLQKFIQNHLNPGELFKEPIELFRTSE